MAAEPLIFKESIRSLMPAPIADLERLYKVAEEFVRVHYACRDQADRNIKILATMNQFIELAKMEQKGQ
jgi:hypothetical protein